MSLFLAILLISHSAEIKCRTEIAHPVKLISKKAFKKKTATHVEEVLFVSTAVSIALHSLLPSELTPELVIEGISRHDRVKIDRRFNYAYRLAPFYSVDIPQIPDLLTREKGLQILNELRNAERRDALEFFFREHLLKGKELSEVALAFQSLERSVDAMVTAATRQEELGRPVEPARQFLRRIYPDDLLAHQIADRIEPLIPQLIDLTHSSAPLKLRQAIDEISSANVSKISNLYSPQPSFIEALEALHSRCSLRIRSMISSTPL